MDGGVTNALGWSFCTAKTPTHKNDMDVIFMRCLPLRGKHGIPLSEVAVRSFLQKCGCAVLVGALLSGAAACAKTNPGEGTVPEGNQAEAAADAQYEGGGGKSAAPSAGAPFAGAPAGTPDIAGRYTNAEAAPAAGSGRIELLITKDGGGYRYEMKTPGRNIKGNVQFTDDPQFFALEGIRWASWEIEGVPQELPDEVTVYIEEDGVVIQNYGGSGTGGNNYMIFDDIDEKFIVLTKSK